MDGVHLDTAIVSAFFHDVGKGGDCVETCSGGACWRDMYSNRKYDGKGEQEHPLRSGDMILGKTPFIVHCSSCAGNCTIDVRRLITKTFKTAQVRHVALAAYMHWEFGKMNIPGAGEQEKIAAYFRAIDGACARCELAPDAGLLRLCIAVACADITAGTKPQAHAPRRRHRPRGGKVPRKRPVDLVCDGQEVPDLPDAASRRL
jgi:hypothetical protein